MSTTVGTIQYDVRLNLNQLKGDTKNAEKIVNDSNRNIEKSSDKTGGAVSGMFGTIATAAKVAGAAAVAAFGGFSYFGLKTAGDLQAAEKGFVTLLGSADEASKVMARIKDEAKKTPFEVAGLTSATQALALVTKDGDKSIDILLDVGKALAAAGKGQPELDRIIANLQQIGLTGKVTEMDIRQFGMNGINILELIADQYGITTAAAAEMQDKGEISFDVLTGALKKAGGAGGKFEKAFSNQAGGFNQSVSNMKDTFMIFASDFVKRTGIFDGAIKIITGFSTVLGDNQDSIYGVVDSIKELALKVFDIGTSVAEYLTPKLVTLWNTISKDLLPVLADFWHNYLEPLVPLIGEVLVFSIGVAVDAVNAMIKAFSGFIDWVNNNKPIVLGLATAFVILAGAMAFNSIFNALTLGFANLTLVTIPSVMTSVGALQAMISAPMVMGAIAVGGAIAALSWLYNETEKTRKAVEQAINTFQKAADISSVVSQTKAFGGQGTKGITILGGAGLSQTNISGNAKGTDHWRGGPTWVGENGPEIVNLPKGSQVVPNYKSGSGGANITLNLSGVMARSRTDLRDIAKDMINAVNEELRAKGKMELAI